MTAAAVDVEDWLAHFNERVAIREYEGGLDRGEAEQLALDDTIGLLGPKPSQYPWWDAGEQAGACEAVTAAGPEIEIPSATADSTRTAQGDQVVPDAPEIGRLFEEMIAEIGLDEMMRLGEIASRQVRSRYVKMGTAGRALFHTKHGVGVLVGARPPMKGSGRAERRVSFDNETRRRLTDHYRGLKSALGSVEETALLRHNVLAYWSLAGIPAEFLDELRASTLPEAGAAQPDTAHHEAPAVPVPDSVGVVVEPSKARGTIVASESWRRSKRTNRDIVTIFTISALSRGVKASAGPLVQLTDTARALPAEVETGSARESASKQRARGVTRPNVVGHGSNTNRR